MFIHFDWTIPWGVSISSKALSEQKVAIPLESHNLPATYDSIANKWVSNSHFSKSHMKLVPSIPSYSQESSWNYAILEHTLIQTHPSKYCWVISYKYTQCPKKFPWDLHSITYIGCEVLHHIPHGSLEIHSRQCRKPSGDSDAVGRETGQGEHWN